MLYGGIMDIVTDTNVVKHLIRLSDRTKSMEPTLKQKLIKPIFNPDIKSSPMPRSTPEEQGISSSYLCDFIDELRLDPSLDMHTVTVVKNGKIILEGSFGPYDTRVWRSVHSLSKSVAAMAIGMLIDEGKLSLDDDILSIFQKPASLIKTLLKKRITVRHLLTMTSGIIFSEYGLPVEEDWVKAFLESGLRTEPGKEFNYNSTNTYMLSAIVHEITGMGLTDYLKPRLFDPLGIKNIWWTRCPKGIEAGGFGLHIIPEDIAKLGQLYIQKGVWEGKRIISESWVNESCTAKVITDGKNGDFDYGYQVWCGKKGNSFLFNGMFGQNMLAYPKTNTIIVTTGGNTELFQQSSYFSIAEKYFGGDYAEENPVPVDKKAVKRLETTLKYLGRSMPKKKPLFFAKKEPALPPECDKYSGRKFDAIDVKTKLSYIGQLYGTKNVSLVPLCIQLMSNIYTKGGITSIGFERQADKFFVSFFEAGSEYRLPIGFDNPESAEFSFGGEFHRLGISGSFTTDEDGHDVLKIKVSFIETSNTRLIKIFFKENGRILVKFKENPGIKLINLLIENIMGPSSQNKLVSSVISKVNIDFILFRIMDLFEPSFECEEVYTLNSGRQTDTQERKAK